MAELMFDAFDCQPTPILILSDSFAIVSLNRACNKLLGLPTISGALSVQDLPIRWQDGTDKDFFNILTRPVLDHSHGTGPIEEVQHRPTALQVSIHCEQGPTQIVATMCVTDFLSGPKSFRMLTFENTAEETLISVSRSTSSSSHNRSPPTKQARPASTPKSYSGTSVSTQASQSQLADRFSQLRDAYFFSNNNKAGFVLSADESFCYPNYDVHEDVVPVEIDDLELFFQNWDVWDPNFHAPLPLRDYPSLSLNDHRQKFEKRRYGVKEDGRNMVYEACGDPLYDPNSGVYMGGVVWLTTLGDYDDVMAADLKATLADIRTICDRLPHLIWTVDANGDADYFSQSWYDFTGLTEAESVGRGFMAAIDPTGMAGIWAQFEQTTHSKHLVTAEAKYRRHDGQWIWMFVRAKPFVDSKGKILKWFGTSTEVHNLVVERHQAERKKSQMMEMLSLQDVGLFTIRADGRLDALEGHIGWLNGQTTVSSYTVLDETQGDGMIDLKAQIGQVIGTVRDSAVFEGQIASRWYKFRLTSDAESILGCSVDVTEQRDRARLEAENTLLVNEAAFEVEKSRLKTAFLAHMSHEIRTPIAGIIGTADMLAETSLGDEQTEAVEDIRVSADNLLTIVNDILDLSKIEAGQLHFEERSFDVHDLVLQVKRLFVRLASTKNLDLTYESQESQLLQMIGDPGRVKQIITNLVSNAIKFTAQGSVKISVDVEGEDVRVSVHDTGDGISEETMATLFQPFAQGETSTARRYGGTGLGLVISKNLADKMSGNLSLESVVSEGTTAVLVLPRQSGHAGLAEATHYLELTSPTSDTQQSPLSPTNDTFVSTSPPLVLVVEDNAINQKIALKLVQKFGYEAEAVWNGQEALDYLESHEKPSMILMDCQMPLMDGYEATRLLRTDSRYQAVKKVPVIALTASAIEGDREKCYTAGMDDYISKPIKKTLLASKLKKWATSTE